jgi:hypothetical protein
MYAVQRQLLTSAVLLAVLIAAQRAAAWIETSVKSDVVTLDVARDGTAVVSHDIVMGVRGGPLTSFELDGVCSDAEPLPDATVAPAASGSAGATSIPLLLNKGDDGVLRIEVDAQKGLGHGTYLFKLRYRTSLVEHHRVELRGAWAEIAWVGPRFRDGIDSARVVFRIPHSPTPPRLPDFAAERPPGREDLDDTFLSNLRRAADKDELEVVRPHVAKGEPVLWRVLVSPKAFDAFSVEEPLRAARQIQVPAAPSTARGMQLPALAALVLLAFAYSALVLGKSRSVAAACRAAGALPRALIPIPAVPRAALSGTLLATSAGLALETDLLTLAGLVFVAAMALAAHIGPYVTPPLRGPGHWLALRDEEAFAKAGRSPRGQWLDAGSIKGFSVLILLAGATVTGSVLLMPTAPYDAAMLALGSAALLPIFCTGRGSELPLDPATAPRQFLAWLALRLRAKPALKIVPWARVPDGGSEPDELRLLIAPRDAKAGLVAIEVGLEYHRGGGGPIALPYVIVRARDRSPSYEALPREVIWVRGRKPEERVAVLRPKLPTWSMCHALLTRVLERVAADSPSSGPKPRQAVRSAAISAGRGSSISKRGSVASPSQAM